MKTQTASRKAKNLGQENIEHLNNLTAQEMTRELETKRTSKLRSKWTLLKALEMDSLIDPHLTREFDEKFGDYEKMRANDVRAERCDSSKRFLAAKIAVQFPWLPAAQLAGTADASSDMLRLGRSRMIRKTLERK